MSYFSKNLKYLREIKKLTQKQLGELAKVNQSTIMRWETGEMSPSLDNLYDVSNVLNISIADLTGRDLTNSDNNRLYEEYEILFDKNKDILTDEDKETIKFLIEKRKRKIDKQLGEE